MVKGDVYLYWMTNSEWYDYDEDEKPYLTDKAPEKAKISFKKYLDLKERERKSGTRII